MRWFFKVWNQEIGNSINAENFCTKLIHTIHFLCGILAHVKRAEMQAKQFPVMKGFDTRDQKIAETQQFLPRSYSFRARSQSYDLELQRPRCKNIQRNKQHGAFL
jgi:hypothetical protein